MNPTIWGPHAWIFLHSITMAYPICPNNNDMKNMRDFFTTLSGILPCTTCRDNYKRHLKELPLTDDILKSREKLIKWLIDFHNIVNVENGKSKMTYTEVQNKYLELYGYDKKTRLFRISLILLVFIIISIILYVLLWNKIK